MPLIGNEGLEGCSQWVYAKIRHAVMIDGLSRREAAKRFGVHRNTITKMLSFSVPAGYRRGRERPTSKKLGPYLAWIDAILEGDSQVHKKQRHTAHRIFERLRDEQGFTGGYTIVRGYVAQAMLRRREMFVPLSHRPGHAQADFGEADGTLFKRRLFAVVLRDGEKVARLRCAGERHEIDLIVTERAEKP